MRIARHTLSVVYCTLAGRDAMSRLAVTLCNI